MPSIQFLSADETFMKGLSAELEAELQKAGLADDLQVSEAKADTSNTDTTARGDIVSVMQIVAIAAGAGGALTVALGKDGFLSALARVLEKYIEGKQAQVVIEKADGTKVQLSGPMGEIKETLKMLKDDA